MASDAGAPTYKGSGFLHSITASNPDTRYVATIKPQMWRTGYVGGDTDSFAVYDRLRSLGVNRIQLVFSDWKKGIPQYDGMSWYAAAVALATRAKNEGKVFEWDLLNEPDYELGNNYYSQWDETYRGIRSVLPDAVIAGPDLICSSSFKEADIKGFLDHAKASNTVPDVITWHFGFPWDLPRQQQILKDYVHQLGLDSKVQDYVCNENILDGDQVISTGIIPTLFASAQRADMNLIHATWPTLGADNTCGRPVLCGILTEAPYRPRGTWWAYKVYADMTGTMLNVTRGGSYDGVACQDPVAAKASALIGARMGVATGALTVRFANMGDVAYLQNSNHQVRVLVERVPCTTGECTGLIALSESNLTVSNNQLLVTTTVNGNESVKITLMHPDARQEAELAQLAGGARVATNQSGYSGTGFVAGLGTTGGLVRYTIDSAQAGRYGLSYKYSAGNGAATNIGLYVNGTRLRTLPCEATADWNSWNTMVEAVELNAGSNSVELKAESTTSATINLDYIYLNAGVPRPAYQPKDKLEAEDARLGGVALLDTEHPGYSGSGYVSGFDQFGSSALYSIILGQAGNYSLKYRYSAGNGTAGNIALFINGARVKSLTCTGTSDWKTWSTGSETVALGVGASTVEFRSEAATTATINLDYISVGGAYATIKCRWAQYGDAYAYDNAGTLSYGSTPSTDSYYWTVESANGYNQIKNKATGHYINIEHLLGYAECSVVGSDWWSKDWMVSQNADGYSEIVSRMWPNSQKTALNIQEHNGTVQYGVYDPNWFSQMWELSSVPVLQSALAVSKASIALPATGGNDNLTISSKTNWDLTGVPAWLAVDFLSGNNNQIVTFQAAANGGVQRSATVIFQCGGMTQAVVVSQAATPNSAPTITAVANQAISVNASTGDLAIVIGDAETPAANLTLSASSDTPALVPPANIVFGGSGANRTVTVTPAAGQSGTATIALRVGDAGGLSTVTSFTVTVQVPTRNFILDRNNDGISDVWAALYPSAGAPTADPDGDGQSNLAEAQAGTDPTSAASRLIATVAPDASGNLVVRWPSIAGKYYFLEASNDLATWTPLPREFAGTSGELSAIVRPAGTNTSTRTFWHVIVFDIDSTGSGLNDWEKTHPEAVATVTATAGANGSISPAGKSYVAKGGSATFAITPAAGYVVERVQVDGQSVGAVGTYTFSAITAGSHTISGSFLAPFTLTVAPTSLSLSAPAGSASVAVSASGAWTASSNQAWLTVSPASGSGNATITLIAPTNAGISRAATITLQGGGRTAQASVEQAGQGTTYPVAATLATDKALYLPGGVVRFSAAFSPAQPSLALRVKYYRWNNLVGTQTIPVSGTSSSWTWTLPATDIQGYLASAELMDGATVLGIATIGINASSDYKQFPIYGFLSSYPSMTDAQMDAQMDRLNRYHINAIQFYDWADTHQQPLAGSASSPAASWNDIANRPTYLATVKGYIDRGHNNYNMRSMFYALIYGSYAEAPLSSNWYLYTGADHTQRWGFPMPGGWETSGISMMDCSNADWRNYFLGNINAVYDATNLHFDGWHVDQLGDFGYMYNSSGQRVDVAQTFPLMLQAAKGARPAKSLIMNAVNTYGQSLIATQAVDLLYAELWDGNLEYSSLGNIIQANEALNPNLKNVFAAYVNRGLGTGVFSDSSVLLCDATIFAFGGANIELGEHMLCNEYFPNNSLAMSPALQSAIITYYDFAVAYGNILRNGRRFNSVSLSGTGAQSWPPVQGKIATVGVSWGGNQVFHCINYSAVTSLIWRDVQPVPAIKSDIPMSFPYATPITRLWVASPDFAMGAPQNVAFTQSNGVVSFVLPSLKYWTMVVAETATGLK
jgi:dextranase